MRVSNRKAPKISARPPTPTPNVPSKSPTLVYPCTQLVPRRYPLTDHFPLASTSAVGTNHNPVSPKNVVVAGRVSSAVAVDEDCVWVAVVLGPVDVPEDPDCAFALAATANASAQATATRLTIVRRLQSVCPGGPITLHDAPPARPTQCCCPKPPDS